MFQSQVSRSGVGGSALEAEFPHRRFRYAEDTAFNLQIQLSYSEAGINHKLLLCLQEALKEGPKARIPAPRWRTAELNRYQISISMAQ